MQALSFPVSPSTVQDSYTDLNGLQSIKNEADQDLALRKVAKQFESMFINLLLKNMRAANDVFSEGNIFDTQEIKFFRDMYDNQLAVNIADSESFGVAEAVYRQLSKNKSPVKANSEELQRLPERNTNLHPQTEALARIATLQEDVNRDAALESDNGRSSNAADARHRVAESPAEFVEKLLPVAERIADKLGVEPSVILAQAALETGWGKKVLSDENGKPSFNLFNIKAGADWTGDSLLRNSLEFVSGVFTNVASKFRSYASVEESFDDFGAFITENPRYQNALNGAKTGLDFIREIHQAGYATDPNYVEKIGAVYRRIQTMLAED